MTWSASTTLGSLTDKVSATSKQIGSLTASDGDLVIFAGDISSGGGGITGLTIADSATNSWTVYTVSNAATNSIAFLAFAIIATGKTWGGASTVTVSRVGTTNITSWAGAVIKFTGGLTASVEDTGVRASAQGNNSTPTVTSNAASVAGDLFVAVCGDNYNSASGYTEASGWTNAFNTFATAATATGVGIAYQVNAGTAALTHNPTLSGGGVVDKWGEIVVAFFVSSGGAAFLPPPNKSVLQAVNRAAVF